VKKKLLATITAMALGTVVVTSANAMGMGMNSKGVKVGVNLANESGSDVHGASTKAGFALGGFATFGLSDKLNLRPEVYYIQKGAKYSGGNLDLSYIDVPVLLEYPVAGGDMPVNVFGGVNVGWLLSAKQGSTDVKSQTHTLDVGAQLGVGTVINKQFTADIRYDYGLRSIAKDATVKNSGFLITGGYLF